jgi:amino acid transporter
VVSHLAIKYNIIFSLYSNRLSISIFCVRMKIIKNLCLIIFAIVAILFTVGYASQPIVTNTIVAKDGNNKPITSTYYIYQPSTISVNISNEYQNANYTNISSDKQLLLNTIFYICIAITIALAGSIIIAMLGLKFISKILFLVILIAMIVTFLFIQIGIIASSLITMVNNKSFSNPNTNNGTGYYLILASIVLMFVNYVIYVILA